MEVRCRTSIAGMPKVEGYLEKRGKFNINCLWKKYWFVLDGRSLMYFKSKDSYESLGVCKGMIDFSRVHVIRVPTKLKHGFPFEIVTRSQVIYLSANDSLTRDIWIEELRHAIRPPLISDPYNTSKVTPPNLSNLFENVCCDPMGNKEKNTNENKISASPFELTKYLEDSAIIEENEENEVITLPDEYKIPELDHIAKQDSVSTSETISCQNTLIPVISENLEHYSKNLEHHKSVMSGNTSLKLLSDDNMLQIPEESDVTDDGNEGSNYETAEETLENDYYFDNKTVRQSYGLLYPLEPEYNLSAYCELKDIVNNLENKETNPSINRLGKSVAVEAMRNFLRETEK